MRLTGNEYTTPGDKKRDFSRGFSMRWRVNISMCTVLAGLGGRMPLGMLTEFGGLLRPVVVLGTVATQRASHSLAPTLKPEGQMHAG